MKLLHTADWHIGQTFHEYDRTFEHEQFLIWLIEAIKTNDIDLLLISGDVFDVSNPSAASIKLFYTFLKDVIVAAPQLQIIITAGNHDSASRLEAPKPLLASSNIHIVGVVTQNEGVIDYEKLVIPIKDKDNTIIAWCMAVPFLRNGDYPEVADAVSPYTEGVAELYKQIYTYTNNKRQAGQPIIAMGHLHTSGASVSEKDKSERLILGGTELIDATAFNENIIYTALGHIHRPQKIGGKEHIRYSGSPIPMSFSEHNYLHQVVMVTIEGDELKQITAIPIPVTVSLKRIPTTHKPLNEVKKLLSELNEVIEDKNRWPYIEVRVLIDEPQPALRHEIETVLENKQVRLATISTVYPKSNEDEKEANTINQLNDLNPLDVFKKVYQGKYKTETPEVFIKLFNEVVQEIHLKEE